jgi:hypothetical protein
VARRSLFAPAISTSYLFIMNAHSEQENQVERRKGSHRFDITAPASFSWVLPDGGLQEGEGTTRDISAQGVFIYARQVPMTRAAIQVSVSIPSREANGIALKLVGTGFVLRATPPESQPAGFAAAVNFTVAGVLTK